MYFIEGDADSINLFSSKYHRKVEEKKRRFNKRITHEGYSETVQSGSSLVFLMNVFFALNSDMELLW